MISSMLQHIPSMWSIIGAVLVTGAVLVSSGKKIVDNLPPHHPVKAKYLSCCYTEDSPSQGPGLEMEEKKKLTS